MYTSYNIQDSKFAHLGQHTHAHMLHRQHTTETGAWTVYKAPQVDLACLNTHQRMHLSTTAL